MEKISNVFFLQKNCRKVFISIDVLSILIKDMQTPPNICIYYTHTHTHTYIYIYEYLKSIRCCASRQPARFLLFFPKQQETRTRIYAGIFAFPRQPSLIFSWTTGNARNESCPSLEQKNCPTIKNIGFHDKKQLSLLTCLYFFLEHLLSPVISCFK